MNRFALLGTSLCFCAVSFSSLASMSSNNTYLQYSGFSARHSKVTAITKGNYSGNLKTVVEGIAPKGWQVDLSPSLDGYSQNAFTWHDQGPWTNVLGRFLTENKINGLIVWPESRIALSRTNPIKETVPATKVEVNQTEGQQWRTDPGQTLRQALTAWSSKAPCAEAPGWVVIWDSKYDYQIDTPLSFSGTFESLLSQVFDLYKAAEKPLFAQANRTQCVLSVSDHPISRN